MCKIVNQQSSSQCAAGVGEKTDKAKSMDWKEALAQIRQEEPLEGEGGFRASPVLIEKLKEMEGLRLEAYRDVAGVPTIGYGHTKGVRMGDRISQYWADDLLRRDLHEAEDGVNALGVAKTQGQFDALVSFVFNLGIERLEGSTLLRRIRDGDAVEAIRSEFMRWVYAGGKRLRGLERRRAWEAERFFSDDEKTE